VLVSNSNENFSLEGEYLYRDPLKGVATLPLAAFELFPFRGHQRASLLAEPFSIIADGIANFALLNNKKAKFHLKDEIIEFMDSICAFLFRVEAAKRFGTATLLVGAIDQFKRQLLKVASCFSHQRDPKIINKMP
jgi:hypothetical protein